LNEIITDETLHTYFKMVQRLLNDRPLAYSPKDCNDLEFLTPNHFLLSGKIGQDLAPVINYEKNGLETQYKIVLSLVDKFWRRFVQEMKPKMALYNKWIISPAGKWVISALAKVDCSLIKHSA
jgi:hypothetical protein